MPNTFNTTYFTDIDSTHKWASLNIPYTFSTAFYFSNLYDIVNRTVNKVVSPITATNTTEATKAMLE